MHLNIEDGIVTPGDIAKAIRLNCDRYDAHQITREVWSEMQQQLWTLAIRKNCKATVMRLVCPQALGSR